MGARFVTVFNSILPDFAQVGLLHQHSSKNALELQFALWFESARGQFKQSQILFRRENCFGLFVKSRRGDAFDKKFRDFFRGRGIDNAIEGQHTAERRNRITRQCLQIRIQERFALGRPAGIVVLDDHCSGLAEFGREASCRFKVDIIVVGKLFTLKLFRRREPGERGARGHVKRRSLVRIFSVAQRTLLPQRDVHPSRGARVARPIPSDPRKPTAVPVPW